MVEPHDAGTSEQLDALRRDLYRPGSSDADVQRYLDERDALGTAEPETDTPPTAGPRRRLLVLGVSVGLGLALLVTLAVTSGRGTPVRLAATPTATATSAGRSIVMDVGDSQTLAVAAGAVTRSIATPTSVGGTPVVGRLFEGSGNAVLSIDPPEDSLRGGTAVVLISSSSRVPVAWRALSRLRLGRAISEPLVLGRGISAEPSGAPVPQTFPYEAESWPARIAVAAPPGVKWSVVVGVAGEEQAPH